MMQQDLTTWFGSQVHVNKPCAEGRPCLDDLSWFGRAPLKNIMDEQQVQLSWCFTMHRRLLKDEFIFHGRATFVFLHQLPLCPYVICPKNALYFSLSFVVVVFFLFLFYSWPNQMCFNHGFSSFKTDTMWLIMVGPIALDAKPCCI